ILVDMARTRNSQKRGSGVEKLSLDDIVTSSSIDLDSILRVDELMSALASIDPRQCEVVEMRIFGGLTNEEIAEVMNISDRTVRREWNAGRAWLISELSR
ncbi:MAG: sigma-70 family RNA polymerase sigma factor, partial [Blastocatellia bacterium]|nr:sigma-70 family RNA polymerase sigma factor [Blastocatellia bacterium]